LAQCFGVYLGQPNPAGQRSIEVLDGRCLAPLLPKVAAEQVVRDPLVRVFL
jgi:hypothetical protein